MKRERKKPMVGVLLGKAPTPTKSKVIADLYHKCPYCISYASAEKMIMGIFSIPQDHQWWLESVVEHPKETMGLEVAEVFFPKYIEASSPWSRGETKPIQEKAPCGADCQGCPEYRKECKGCPATKYYKEIYGKS